MSFAQIEIGDELSSGSGEPDEKGSSLLFVYGGYIGMLPSSLCNMVPLAYRDARNIIVENCIKNNIANGRSLGFDDSFGKNPAARLIPPSF